MNKINNVTIGISTFGPYPRAHYLIDSIRRNMADKGDLNVNILLVDDGTPPGQLDDRRRFCQAMDKKMRNEMGVGVRLLEQGTNGGIPKLWNRLLVENDGAQLLVIFSDGFRLMMSGWLSRMVHFMEVNEGVGTLGMPHLPDPSLYVDSDERWTCRAGRVGAAVGSSFCVRPDVMLKVENPDGSRGYFQGLISFHEEIIGGFNLAKLGYLSYMLPFPPGFYRGGMCFQAHPELIWTEVNPDLLPLDEFLFWVRQSAFYVPAYEEHYQRGVVDRMSYSRQIYNKYFGVHDECRAGRRYQTIKGEENVDILDCGPKFSHPVLVDSWPARKITWLNKNGDEESCMDA